MSIDYDIVLMNYGCKVEVYYRFLKHFVYIGM